MPDNEPAKSAEDELPADRLAGENAGSQLDGYDQLDGDDEAIVATIVPQDIVPEARVGPVRTGSPFVKDPPAVLMRARAVIQMRREFEAGMWRITAGGAVLSAAMLLMFALAALYFFQVGTLLITGLGGVMSLLGLTSLYPKWSLSFLLAHIGLFVGTFWLVLKA